MAATAPKNHDEGKKGKLTRYVTESGYEEFEDERTRAAATIRRRRTCGCSISSRTRKRNSISMCCRDCTTIR